MRIKIKYGDYYYSVLARKDEISDSEIPVIFLHGFTGSALDWISITDKLPEKYFPICPDFFGHGKSESPVESGYYSAKGISAQIESLYKYFNFEKAAICGYSMGGRGGLTFFFDHPERVIGLLLESANPGIRDISEKNDRAQNDRELAEKIENAGIEWFTDYWQSLPLFNSQNSLSSQILDKIRKMRISNSPTGLRNSLMNFSPAVMENYWPLLNTIEVPVEIICGELDIKYTLIGGEMEQLIPGSQMEKIPNAGHNVHLEKPEIFYNLLLQFLFKL